MRLVVGTKANMADFDRTKTFKRFELLGIDFRDLGHEAGRVEGFVRVREEVCHVEHAALVFDVRFLALADDSSDAPIFADGVEGFRCCSLFGCRCCVVARSEASEEFSGLAEWAKGSVGGEFDSGFEGEKCRSEILEVGF